MAVINVLPPHLANQIAAGEVVERPASVVKELVENSLDAGARRVNVTIELGGKRSMKVEDDGVGMTAEDARLALERHATSKISSAEDLAAIETLGFRGEALPSIASVSHFTLRTRNTGASTGTEIQVDGGTVASVREIGAPEGTSIEVRELFFNLPARRKFLKSDAAEAAQISKLMAQFALGYPEVGFTLTSTGRRVMQYPPAQSLEARFFQIFGDRPDLAPIFKEAAGIRLTGYIAALTEQGPARGAQQIFVNRRIVRDRTIAHAIIDAYSKATIKERSPEVYLFFELGADRVDVNVHPTKAEVRFGEPQLIHELVRRALMETLGQVKPPELRTRDVDGGASDAATDAGYGLRSGAGASSFATAERSFGAGFSPASGAGSASEQRATPAMLPGVLSGAFEGHRPGAPPPARFAPWRTSPPSEGTAPSSPEGAAMVDDRVSSLTEGLNAALGLRAGVAAPQSGLIERHMTVDPDRALVPLGQFRDTFIIAIDGDGISIIDQHVAHERILFEQILERLTSGPLPSQRLLEPVLIELSVAQREALAMHQEVLTRFGIEVVEFGGDSLRVAAVPAILRFEEAAAAVRALADDLEGLDRGARVEIALRRIAALMACHAAVKANDPLTFEKMRYLLTELRRTAYSTICPHGRPVVLRLSRREVEKNFDRA
jgi:DNA mismatch repair protein MutL